MVDIVKRIEKLMDLFDEGERINLYDGGVVKLAKDLSDQGKSADEIFKAIEQQFSNLSVGKPGGFSKRGTEGRPSDVSGVRNILKKELSPEVYKQRHGPKRFTQETIDRYLQLRNTMGKAQIQKELDISPAKQGKIDKEYGLGRRKQIVTKRKFSPEDIEKFRRLRPIRSETDIRRELGISEGYQRTLARQLGLPPKDIGGQVLSKKFQEAKSVGTAIQDKIDLNKSVKENFDAIYPDVKDQKFRVGTTQFGKPSERAVKKAINQTLMDANQLSVDEYKEEIRKMVADRNYVPKGLDPLGIKTEKLTNYAIPNYLQAKKELAKEIPSLDKRINTNIGRRKKTKRKLKEIENPLLKQSRLGQASRRRQKRRLEKLGLSIKLSPREEAINLAQTTIQKSSNDRIKQNPETMKKFLNDNPNILKALGTRVNRQTGQIYYENANLDFLNTDPKDTQRYFELDHGREISKQAGRLTDVPENRNTIPSLLNRGFKRDAEIYIESNPNPKDPRVRAILDEAKKLNVRIRPKVPTGTFKADDFFRPTPNPLLKIQNSISFYAPEEFHTKEIVLPVDKKGKTVTKLFSPEKGQLIESDLPSTKRLAAIGCPGKMMGGRVKLAEGENLTRCAVRGINKLRTTDPKNLTLADRANYQAIRKSSQGARLLKNTLGPAALAIEALFAAPFAAFDYASGRRGKDIALSALSLGLADEKLRRDELKEYFPEYGKGQALLDLDERLMELERQQKGTRGQRIRSKGKLNIGLKKFDEAIKELPTEESLLDNLEKSRQAEMDLAKDEAERKKQRVSPFGFDSFSAAGGGIAKLAGVDEGPPPPAGPNSQGLQGLLKRVKKL